MSLDKQALVIASAGVTFIILMIILCGLPTTEFQKIFLIATAVAVIISALLIACINSAIPYPPEEEPGQYHI